jgi:Saccharopine dehydrogenase NADP binding domain
MALAADAVLVVGAAGYFGRLLVADLIASRVPGRILLGGRNAAKLDEVARAHAGRPPLETRPVMLEHEASVAAALEGVKIAACAAGPFQTLPLTLPRLCLARGIAYLDLSDDRRFTAQVRALAGAAPDARAPIFSGWSAVPALVGVLGRIAATDLDTIAALDLQIAPGNRMPRARGTVASLLDSVGRSFPVWRDGRWQSVHGWSEPRAFDFPAPVGRRVGYLVDVPAHDDFPALFSCARVEFRVGAELSLLNHGVSFLGLLVRARLVRSWAPFTPLLRSIMSVFGGFGSETGGVGVEVAGERAGRRLRRRASVVAATGGQVIPVMPATIMIERCLREERGHLAPVSCDRWIERGDLECECARRGFRLVLEEEAG